MPKQMGKTKRPQSFTENYKQVKNVKSQRNGLPQEKNIAIGHPIASCELLAHNNENSCPFACEPIIQTSWNNITMIPYPGSTYC